MRPPIPTVALSRRAKIALWTVAVVVVLLIVLVQLTGVYINWQWFGSVGYHGVYSTIFWTRVVLFFVFGAVMAAVIAGNVVIAYRLSPPFRPMSPEQQNIERYRALVEPRRLLVLLLLGGIVFLTAGLSAAGNWTTWQLWLHGGSFGISDPQFHKDISFYAWDYPAYRSLLGFGFTAIIFSVILSVVVHYLTGAIRLQTPGPKVTPAARRHLTLLAFVFIVLKAIAYWLDRYGLVFSGRGGFTGASYTDVHAVLPARTILFWIAIIIAAGLIASLWLRNTLLPGIAFVSMLVLSILISGIYPAILQQVSVKPNQQSKEAPYIGKNIAATRQAYGIVNGTDVTYQPYAATPNPPASQVVPTNPTVSNIRILDPNVLSPTFTQQQQVLNQYGFAPKLDIDRYTLDGITKDYVVGVRELDANNLTGNQANWINEHTVYTHGNGFVAAQAATDVTNNDALYTEKDISPTVGPLGLTQPAVYFGELLPDYSVVGAQGKAIEFNGSSAPVTYAGNGGIPLSNVLTRLAFAVNYKQSNFLLNGTASAPGAQVIINRDPRERVKKVAPWLTVDSDPYPVVDTGTGHIVWMVDGYTTIDNYPYSQRDSLSGLTQDSLSTRGRTAQQPNDQINYIRNSVKATVDAYTGQVNLYAWQPDDPVLKAWESVFPGVVKPISSMPQALYDHVRYPEDLFKAQRALLATYHVSNAVKFYNVANKWSVPLDPNDSAANQPPYYVLAARPGATSDAPQFQLTTPMTVNNKPNLSAYISVDSDPGPDHTRGSYGHITVLTVPSGSVTQGPSQISNLLTSNPYISHDLSLFNTQGGKSQTIDGNLLTLPVGDSFLYVEPLYLQKSGGGGGSYPTLKRVLVVYGGSAQLIGYGENLAQALKDLGPEKTVGQYITDTGQGQNNSGNGGSSSGPPSPSPTPSGSTTPTGGRVTQQQLQAAYAALNAAAGNAVKYSQAQADLIKLLGRYLQQGGALPSSSTSSSGSASPSTSSGGAPSATPTGGSTATSASSSASASPTP